jgi:hypothetical protein
MDEGATTEIDLRDGEERTVDLTHRLRFAAGSLAADLSDEISLDHAEALVFSSAEGLLAAASVTEFVPILAERRARLAVRSAVLSRGGPAPVAPAREIEASLPVLEAVPVETEDHAVPSGVEPLMAVPERDLTRLRNDIERLRMQVADWRADQRRRGEPAV